MKTHRKQVTLAMMIATFLAAIEVTIVSTAMPRIVSDLGGLQLISWVFSVYLLAGAVATPIFGKLTDLFGRKMIFTIGAVIFLAGSMLSGLARSMHQLIWFRALQGFGGGVIIPTTFTIIGDIYPYEERAKVQGYFSSIWGLSGIVGPLVGGFLVDHVSWRWIFYLNLPFGIVSVVMLWMFLKEEGLAKKKRNIDWAGATLFTFGITALLFALLTGGVKYAWTSPLILGLLAAGIVLLALFLWLETRVPEPMLPLGLFRIPAITVSNLAGFLSSALLIGLNVYLPLWVQGVSGKGATGAGLVLLPMSIGWPLGATLGGRLMLRTGPRRTAFVGLLLILSGTVWLANVEPGWSHWHLYAIMLVTGFGFGFVTTVMTVIVQSSVGWNLRGVATASNTLLRTLGQTLGVAVFGMLFNHWIAAELATRPEKSGISPARFNALLNPHGMKTLEGKELAAMRDVLAYGIHHLFMALVVLALATLAVTLLFPARRPEMHDAPGNLKRA